MGLLCSASSLILAQNLAELDVLNLYDEKKATNLIGIYGDNTAECPITVVIDFPQKKNVKISKKLPATFVIPAKSEKVLLMDVETIKGKSS